MAVGRVAGGVVLPSIMPPASFAVRRPFFIIPKFACAIRGEVSYPGLYDMPYWLGRGHFYPSKKGLKAVFKDRI